jgi:AcrR family transcriptional regulator
MSTPYAAARRHSAGAVHRSLLDVAGALLAEHGPDALTMRRIATAAGCSTQVLYTAFGGKDGLAEALFREGFRRFAERFAAVPEDDDPLQRLMALGKAYRANALENPHYYRVMFMNAIPGFAPSDQARAEADATLESLITQVARCIHARVFRAEEPRAVAETIWAASHGAVSLELAGFFPPEIAAARYHALTTAAGAAFLDHGSADPNNTR